MKCLLVVFLVVALILPLPPRAHAAACASNADSLQAFWSLEEVSGTRNDSHGTNHLTDNNTVTQAVGKVGSAAQFTRASSEYLSIASNLALRTGNIDFSITGWLYADSFNTADQVILSKGNLNAYATSEYTIEIVATDQPRIIVGDGTLLATSATWGSTLSTATWYFFHVYHDAGASEIGISINDGTHVTAALAFDAFDSTNEFVLGRFGTLNAGYHNGRIDQVGLWKCRLTSGQITFLYNSGNGRTYGDIAGRRGSPIIFQ